MDGYSIKLWLGIGIVVVLVFLWLVWKFFFSLLKHFIILLILGSLFVGVYWYRSLPPKNPSIGKHAYLIENGKYLGVVEGQSEDPRRGDVWITRAPGEHQKMYGKSRVTLKDKRDIASEPTPVPTATPTPQTKTQTPAKK